jgi:prephenate dehydrogenase
VRLAKSSANTWSPIFLQNKENIIISIDEYIKNLKEFKEMIVNNDDDALKKTMNNTNYLKTILNGIK